MIHDKKGFTSLELIIVLVMIAMVSAFIVPGLLNLQNKQTSKSLEELNKMMNQAIVSYYGVIGDYPTKSRLPVNTYEDINEAMCQDILQELYDVTGYQLLKNYSFDDYKMNIQVINAHVIKIEFENR